MYMSELKKMDAAYAKDYARELLSLKITGNIFDWMKENDVDKATLARLLGTSRSHVTQLLSGTRNMTIHSLADICLALEVDLEFHRTVHDGENIRWLRLIKTEPTMECKDGKKIYEPSQNFVYTGAAA